MSAGPANAMRDAHVGSPHIAASAVLVGTARLELGGEPDPDIEDEYGGDGRPVQDITGVERDTSGRAQQDHDDATELAEEHSPGRHRTGYLEVVGAVAGEPFRSLCRAQPSRSRSEDRQRV